MKHSNCAMYTDTIKLIRECEKYTNIGIICEGTKCFVYNCVDIDEKRKTNNDQFKIIIECSHFMNQSNN